MQRAQLTGDESRPAERDLITAARHGGGRTRRGRRREGREPDRGRSQGASKLGGAERSTTGACTRLVRVAA